MRCTHLPLQPKQGRIFARTERKYEKSRQNQAHGLNVYLGEQVPRHKQSVAAEDIARSHGRTYV